LDRKQLKLKKVDESGEIHGILYKGKTWENTSMNDSIYNYDNNSDSLFGYEVKYPEPGDDCDSTDWKPFVDINNKILILCYDAKQFEEQVEELLDVPVMIDYNVFLSSINAIDNSGKNMFWAIYDKATTQRMTLAPWDLDCTFGQRWGGTLVHEDNDLTSPEYFSDVAVACFFNFNRTNALQYNDRVNERYQELRQDGNLLSTDSLIKRITKYYNAIKKSGAAQRETDKWSGDSDINGEAIDFDKEYEYICDWITKHLEAVDKKGFPVQYDKEYMDRIFANIPSLTINKKSDNYIYTLNGQRIDSTKPLKHGIYIHSGNKIIIK
jgi:spore coat protein CotH